MSGTPTDFAAFAQSQGNQDGSGAPGFGPAGPQPAGSDAPGRGRTRAREGDTSSSDFGYQRVPAASPRTSPYGDMATGNGPQMEAMFRQFFQFMVQGMQSTAGGETSRGIWVILVCR